MKSNEIWKDIKGYEGLYQVSNLGRIKSVDRIVIMKHYSGCNATHSYKGKILKQQKDKYGYMRVALSKNGKIKLKQVHRLVAETFIPNPENKPTVNHEDGNKENNVVANLSWATHQEQTMHAFKTGLIDNSKKNYKEIGKKISISKCVPILQCDKDNNVIKKWQGICIAKKETGINNIEKCLNGTYKTAGGYKWKRISEVMKNDL